MKTFELETNESDVRTTGFEGKVVVGGVRLHVARLGDGPELVVIHGGPDWDHSYLRAFMDPLKDHAHMVFFDLRGCGRSERFEKASALHARYAAEDIRNLIAHLNLSRPALLGFGFGGRIGLEFLARYPGKVSRFILASSSAYPVGSGQKAFLPRGFPTAGRGNEIRNFALNDIEHDVRHEEARPDMARIIRKLRFSSQWLETIRRGLPIADPQGNYEDVLLTAGIPTLVLHGELDVRFPAAEAERLASALPNARLSILPGAGHFAHVDAPEAWNSAIADFLTA